MQCLSGTRCVGRLAWALFAFLHFFVVVGHAAFVCVILRISFLFLLLLLLLLLLLSRSCVDFVAADFLVIRNLACPCIMRVAVTTTTPLLWLRF